MAEQRQFVLAVDLDGVVADFHAGLKPIAAEWLGVAEATLTDDVSYGFPEWGLDACGGYDALHRFAVKERGLFGRLTPIAGAPAGLRRLSTRGIRIRIVTHRLYIPWFHREAIEQTSSWLEWHAVPYWDLCFMRDKAAVGANLYLEDSPGNIEALLADGHPTIALSNSTNHHVDVPRAADWQTMEQLIVREIVAWERRDSPRRLAGV